MCEPEEALEDAGADPAARGSSASGSMRSTQAWGVPSNDDARATIVSEQAVVVGPIQQRQRRLVEGAQVRVGVDGRRPSGPSGFTR